MTTPQHCPGFEHFKALESFLCRCPECGEDKEIFSDEFSREHHCSRCGKQIDFTRCKLDSSSKTNSFRQGLSGVIENLLPVGYNIFRITICFSSQWKLSPFNGIYEYSAIVTDNKTWKPKELLLFVSGRSAQENSISELKTNFAFDHIPTNTYQANSAYMQMSQMVYNLATSMQHGMGLSQKRKSNGKYTRIFKIVEWKTFKFLILNRAGRIGLDQGKKVLELTENYQTKLLYEQISTSLNGIELKKAA